MKTVIYLLEIKLYISIVIMLFKTIKIIYSITRSQDSN